MKLQHNFINLLISRITLGHKNMEFFTLLHKYFYTLKQLIFYRVPTVMISLSYLLAVH